MIDGIIDLSKDLDFRRDKKVTNYSTRKLPKKNDPFAIKLNNDYDALLDCVYNTDVYLTYNSTDSFYYLNTAYRAINSTYSITDSVYGNGIVEVDYNGSYNDNVYLTYTIDDYKPYKYSLPSSYREYSYSSIFGYKHHNIKTLTKFPKKREKHYDNNIGYVEGRCKKHIRSARLMNKYTQEFPKRIPWLENLYKVRNFRYYDYIKSLFEDIDYDKYLNDLTWLGINR